MMGLCKRNIFLNPRFRGLLQKQTFINDAAVALRAFCYGCTASVQDDAGLLELQTSEVLR